mgnify:CR=1 FL=1
MTAGCIPEKLFSGNRLTVSPGGKGANQAVAAARLGADVMMVGCIGDDVYGQLVLKALKENNVDSTYVKVLPGENSGTAHITVAEDDNTIIVIKAANDLVSPSLIDERGGYQQGRHGALAARNSCRY